MKKFLISLGVLFTLTLGNGTLDAATPHYVGELYGGGIVIWVDCNSLTGEHGLIAALTDQSSNAKWDAAITLCTSLGAGWRLPTKDELYILCCKRTGIPGGVVNGLKATNNSLDLTGYYWSSTPSPVANHYYQYFMNNGVHSGGNTNYSLKTIPHSVRAVKSF